jgi:glycosyltransferase involved in cell wall biosynthesis
MNEPPALKMAPLIAEGLFSFQIGGSERVGADLALAFVARGYRVICFALYGTTGPIRDDLEARGIKCVDLDYTSRNKYLRRITYQWEFYRFLRANKARALHVHHATALILCGIPARLAGTSRVVMTEHALHQLVERPKYRRSAMRYCRFAHAITAVHKGIADYFNASMGVPADRIHVVPNGVSVLPSVGRNQNIRTSIGVPEDCFMFLFAGRLEAVKDVGTLLGAVAAIPATLRSKIRLCIAGDGSERTALEAVSRELQLGQTVCFLGARMDVPALLTGADAFVMTSVTEGLPMALIEAMAAAVPCIATTVGGIPDLFRDGAGLLVPPGRPPEIAEAMCRLLLDQDLRTKLSAAGLRAVRGQYDLETAVTKYLALLGLPSHWPSAAQ